MKLASLIPPMGSNKYEICIVAAREARRLNEWSRQSGQVVPDKVTAVAARRVIDGEVAFLYEDEMVLAAEPVEVEDEG